MSRTLSELMGISKDELINIVYNTWISGASDKEDAKRIPYMGWFWRSVDVVGAKIPIGFTTEPGETYVGIMANNKWGYPERMMSASEAEKFIDFIDRAIVASRLGGLLSDILVGRDEILSELFQWVQELPRDGAY